MEVIEKPRIAAVYNIGGSRYSNCSILEATSIIQDKLGREMEYTISEENRVGDHIWWISDIRKFQHDYPAWRMQWDIRKIIGEIIEATRERQNN